MSITKTAQAVMLLLALQLQGCGRKGPLFMQPAVPVPASSAPIEQKPANPDQSVPNQPEIKK